MYHCPSVLLMQLRQPILVPLPYCIAYSTLQGLQGQHNPGVLTMNSATTLNPAITTTAGFARAEVSLLKKIEAQARANPECLGLRHFSPALYVANPLLSPPLILTQNV